MRKIIKIVILLLFISGCSSIKQGYRNFTAYYNTFYNTNQHYDDGLRLNQRQGSQLNPNLPIRIHQPPSNAGLNEFQSAIETGSSILRDHTESKYLLPALFIIGKSYYYRSEFFSALEKFNELEALSDGRKRQEAVYWQGLTYLEMINYEAGIELLESGIEVIPNWEPEILADTKTVLAQLYIQIGDHRKAVEYLEEAIPYIDHQENKSRAFFLLGQALESLGLLEQAIYPYRAISNFRPSFEIEYHARRKEAELAREIGYFERAERIFRRMSRDSKYLTYQSELMYEIARTKQFQGNYEEALVSYNHVIEGRYRTPLPVTLAKTYYGMGEIYRDYYMDYTRAANFFERSATQRVDATLLPIGFDANELAASFGRYAELNSQINENDSLLVLANMSDEELKDFISELQRLEQERFNQDARDLRREQGRVAAPADSDISIDISTESEFGFLNIKNRSKQVEASLQFQTIWGDRPIADNWRRRDAVSGNRFERVVVTGEWDEEIDLRQDIEDPSIRNIIELSHIPFSEEEQLSLRRETESLKYQLGNVFFLTLNMPDSARVYYEKVIDSGLEMNLVTMSMYSLAELELSMENLSEAHQWFDSLVGYNPGSRYAAQLAARLDIDYDSVGIVDIFSTAAQYSQLLDDQITMNPAIRAERILEIAEQEESEPGRIRLYLDAAFEYMKAAQLEMGSSDLVENWMQAQNRFELESAQYERRQELSRITLSDTTITESEREYWISLQESSPPKPNFTVEFPYVGAYWDSTRSVLERIDDEYRASPLMGRVSALNQELQFSSQFALSTEDESESVAFLPPIDSPQDPVQTESPPTPIINQPVEELEITRPEPEISKEEVSEPEASIKDIPTDEVASKQTVEDSYSIALYSFRNEEAANSTANNLIKFGYGVYVCPRIIDDSTYYRVSVGSFADIIGAIQASRVLEEPYNAQYFISSMNYTCEIISLPVQDASSTN